ncbi:MAG: DEAD/DEAH box helicase, partial [Micrococcales bacterium]|nr:DEAD/DEAH box helicase [Micrococcales bacterium]
VLGDEMGLGKTIQALAVMSHLASQGAQRFLVVCPASVLATWLREIAAHTTFPAHRLHGDGRDAAAQAWRRAGGVAVTTYETLEAMAPDGDVGLFVVDEAHYVKHSRTQRAQAVTAWAGAVWQTLFLTGTPMDNRLDDFVALVRILQPDVVASLPTRLGLLGADAFRRAVAPVYLRRNQRDVLTELPELIATDDWVDLSPADQAVYREAVRGGNLMAIRQAAWAGPAATCAKLERLRQIVGDAHDEGRAVVVFTFFRSVAETVATAVRAAGIPVFGPLTGDVAVADRDGLIDAWAGQGAGVLVAQITVGGTGLNLQAASVVLLCEPQLTPAVEAQAVARAHRMGQVRTVQVHRLLAEGTADARIVELLAGKQQAFDEYVRTSALAAATAQAVGVSQAELARDVVASEQARLGQGPVWDALASGSTPPQ